MQDMRWGALVFDWCCEKHDFLLLSMIPELLSVYVLGMWHLFYTARCKL